MAQGCAPGPFSCAVRLGKMARFHATHRLPISVAMPTYCYRDPQGALVEITMSVAEKAERERNGVLVEGGVRLERDIAAEHAPQRGNAFCGANWPMESDALGVACPSEIPAAMADARARGVNLNFTRDGRAILENPAHRRQAMRAYGYFDKAGYC